MWRAALRWTGLWLAGVQIIAPPVMCSDQEVIGDVAGFL